MLYKNDKIWVNNLKILFDKNRIVEFIPTKDMSMSEKLNSLVRLSIYLSISLALCKNNYLYLYICITMGIITYLIYVFNDNLEPYSDFKTEHESIYVSPNIDENECKIPTKDNPFMNPLLTDKRTNKKACKSYNNIEIQNQINNNFNNRLYKDVSEVFNKNNSQRSFYTVPSTTFPNDREKFTKWLYKLPKTCKEGNGNQCVGNIQTPHGALSRHY